MFNDPLPRRGQLQQVPHDAQQPGREHRRIAQVGDVDHWFDASVVWIDPVNGSVGNEAADWGQVKTLYR
jgi:hypothetical protein